MRRALTFCATLTAVTAAAALGAPSALGCSCAGDFDLAKAIDNSDAAFIGTLVKRYRVGREPTGPVVPTGGPGVYKFHVMQAVKRDLGRVVKVYADLSGAACGLAVTPGHKTALLLDRRKGRWTSSLCAEFAPREMRAAALKRAGSAGAASGCSAGA
jgi:hypothetical protein